MKIFIDNEFKCYPDNADGRRAFDVAFFDGKCDEFIKGYRYIPAGESWTREDGIVFLGEAVFPWDDYNSLVPYQEQYESFKEETADMENALAILLGGETA